MHLHSGSIFSIVLVMEGAEWAIDLNPSICGFHCAYQKFDKRQILKVPKTNKQLSTPEDFIEGLKKNRQAIIYEAEQNNAPI
jgi:hypothetical protein